MRGATPSSSGYHKSAPFQSTLLMRRATWSSWPRDTKRPNFNPRSSCEERPKRGVRDIKWMIFQSTLLMRGATRWECYCRYVSQISIHAPHARSDAKTSATNAAASISIHAPHARSDDYVCAYEYHDLISIHAPHARSDV